MKLPKKLNILGTEYKVTEQRININNEYVLGLCIPFKNDIIINTPLIEEYGGNTQQTLLHEMIHAILHRSGATQKISEELEEVICECISNALIDNFKITNKR